ncbi:hypothetical protein DSM25558_4514 [Agrobacterium sp. DSM 25558]|uniref:hypothetical protein n=1 Tax=Agrobacterium sp. DSM 25558 TaxID=1907665 RepID=UPI0009726156|nr:hypothetical protein [Agrobacterium sp. DSM 25558]SCX28600.1 hypothetical protein DSM25558_4514 [Agrobacterium sp. DSM 25558]
MSDVISVLTFKSVETILADGGTQSWALDRTRAARCDYVVVCRNAKTREAQGPEPHGTAFLVGKVKDVVASTETAGRWLILISEYARTNVPDQWSGRNPVAYWSDRNFSDIDFKGLTYQPIAASKALGLTIAEAKAGLAVTFDVPESAIEITIRG